MKLPEDYQTLLRSIKKHIQTAQIKAALSANRELIILYWEIGSLIIERQNETGWGAGIIPQLARDLHSTYPDLKGFSERNLKYMAAFAKEYSGLEEIVQTPSAQLQPHKNKEVAVADTEINDNSGFSGTWELVVQIPWSHNIVLMEKVKNHTERLWYMQQTVINGWSHSVLKEMIKSSAFTRSGTAVTNFSLALPEPQSDLAQQTIKDPYIFDFLTLTEGFREKDLENQLLEHMQRFLMELGSGFAFVGRQYNINVDGEDFYLDLLFYHLKLNCFIVIELKIGEFKPEYAGKMNFYLSAVDDVLRRKGDNPSIGLILCQEQRRIIAEYALRGMSKPIGISEYELTRALPQDLASSLPTIEQIEEELSTDK